MSEIFQSRYQKLIQYQFPLPDAFFSHSISSFLAFLLPSMPFPLKLESYVYPLYSDYRILSFTSNSFSYDPFYLDFFNAWLQF